MGRMRRENEEDDLLFDAIFDEFERTMRLVAIKDKQSIFAALTLACFDVEVIFEPQKP
jgi:hypothetical protein